MGRAAVLALTVLAVLAMTPTAPAIECNHGDMPCTLGGDAGCNFFLDAEDFLDRTGTCADQIPWYPSARCTGDCAANSGELKLSGLGMTKKIKGLRENVFANMTGLQ